MPAATPRRIAARSKCGCSWTSSSPWSMGPLILAYRRFKAALHSSRVPAAPPFGGVCRDQHHSAPADLRRSPRKARTAPEHAARLGPRPLGAARSQAYATTRPILPRRSWRCMGARGVYSGRRALHCPGSSRRGAVSFAAATSPARYPRRRTAFHGQPEIRCQSGRAISRFSATQPDF
jgi:hypothetical protein